MKCNAVLKNLTLFLLVICMAFTSVFYAGAVDDVVTDNDVQTETQAEENTGEVSSEPETEFIPENTEASQEEQTEAPQNEPQQTETEPDNNNENITDNLQVETENQVDEQENIQDNTVQTKALPTIAPTTEKRVVNKDDLTYGYVSWACVTAGILVLIIVFISIKSSGIKKSKRKRR